MTSDADRAKSNADRDATVAGRGQALPVESVETGSPPPIVVASLLRSKGPTGVQTHVAELGNHLRSIGHPHSLVTPYSAGGTVRDAVFGLRRLVQPVSSAAGVWWYTAFHRSFLEQALRHHLYDGQPAVVYCQCPASALAALKARRGPCQRVVLAVHFCISQADEWVTKGAISEGGAVFGAIRRLERHVLDRIDGVVFVSEPARAQLWAALPEGVPNAVFPNFFTLPEVEREHPSRGDLLSVGSLEPNKNHRFILSALAAAGRRGYRYRLDIAGTGPCERALLDQARRMGIAPQVRLLGYVPEVKLVMGGYRAYVHAAKRESFGLAVAEAMAAGLPVVAPPVGGITQFLSEGVEGRYWPIDDPHAGAQVLIELMENEPLRVQMGRAGRRRCAAELDTAVVAPGLLDFLAGVARDRDRSPETGPDRPGDKRRRGEKADDAVAA